MSEDKWSLSQETKRRFVGRTIAEGAHNILCGKQTALFLGLNVLMVGTISGYYASSPSFLNNYLHDTLPIVFILAEILFLFFCGYRKGSYEMYRDFVRIGHVNWAGEAPILVDRQSDENVVVLTFTTKGIPIVRWQEATESIQSALNMTVVSIRVGHDNRSIVVTAVPTADVLNSVLLWDDHYTDMTRPTRFVLGKDVAGQTVSFDLLQQPHGLIGGQSGCGKTSLAVCLLRQSEIRDKYYDTTVLDFKGLDFDFLRRQYGTQVITDMDDIIEKLVSIEQEIEYRKGLFISVGAKDLNDFYEKTGTLLKRTLVYIDECAMLTDYGTSKEARQKSSEVIDKLAGLTRISRSFGIHFLISTQRPDMNAVPGPIKSNLDLRVCGKSDETLSRIVLDNTSASERIDKQSVGQFVMADGGNGILFKAFHYVE